MALKAIAEMIQGEWQHWFPPEVVEAVEVSRANPEIEHLDYAIGYLRSKQLKLNQDNSDSPVADVAIDDHSSWDGYETAINTLMELRDQIAMEGVDPEDE